MSRKEIYVVFRYGELVYAADGTRDGVLRCLRDGDVAARYTLLEEIPWRPRCRLCGEPDYDTDHDTCRRAERQEVADDERCDRMREATW